MEILNKKIKPKESEVYNYYWKYIAARQDIFWRKIENNPIGSEDLFHQHPIWTKNKILQEHRFTNVYREADRVSQFLIREVIYKKGEWKSLTEEDFFFRINLFKFFNKIETWMYLEQYLDKPILWKNFNFDKYNKILTKLKLGGKIYSNAYMCTGSSPLYKEYNLIAKHEVHLKAIELMMKEKMPLKIVKAKGLEEAFEKMRVNHGMGNFIAWQHVIDLNYSPILNYSEDSYVVAGHGAKRGIEKAFSDFGDYTFEDLIKYVKDKQHSSIEKLGLSFKNLWGRDLSLMSCQNNFCEYDKYLRGLRPNLVTEKIKRKQERRKEKGRQDYQPRIKQTYKESQLGDIKYYFPPKFGINKTVEKYYENLHSKKK